MLDWDPARLAAMRAAMIGWCLGRPALRDVALVQWASDQAGGDVAIGQAVRDEPQYLRLAGRQVGKGRPFGRFGWGGKIGPGVAAID